MEIIKDMLWATVGTVICAPIVALVVWVIYSL